MYRKNAHISHAKPRRWLSRLERSPDKRKFCCSIPSRDKHGVKTGSDGLTLDIRSECTEILGDDLGDDHAALLRPPMEI